MKRTHVMGADEILDFLGEHFPQAREFASITHIGDETLCMTLDAEERHLRPGGTISGPVMMTLADTASYYLLLSLLGPVALAVTTSLHIDFLRRPKPGPLQAEASLLKLGRRLAVCTVHLRTADVLVAHASVTYSLPPAG